jgi:hypothetical protein
MGFIQRCLIGLALFALMGNGQETSRKRQGAAKSDDFIFEVEPSVIAPGETAVLYWSIKGATKVVIEEASTSNGELHKIGEYGASGRLEIRPRADTTYVVSCEGSTKYSCASISLRVRVKQH